MSATINPELYASYFHRAPVLQVPPPLWPDPLLTPISPRKPVRCTWSSLLGILGVRNVGNTAFW
eukprot:638929-Prorocentrum_minimum.AAC.1